MDWNQLNDHPDEGQYVLVKIKEGEVFKGGFVAATYGGGNYFMDNLFFTITNNLESVEGISFKIDRILIEGWIPASDLV